MNELIIRQEVSDIFEVLRELREKGTLCDAVIEVGSNHYPVHRAVLAAISPYFKALFTNGMLESNLSKVALPGISSEIMEIILDYAYSLKLCVNESNVLKVLPIADQFNVIGLKEGCCQYLKSHLRYDNCLGILRFAKHYFCDSLVQDAEKFALRNWSEVGLRSPELLMLNVEELAHLLGHDNLNVSSEEIAMETLIRWIEQMPISRSHHLPHLLSKIRLGFVDYNYLNHHVRTYKYVRSTRKCRPQIERAIASFRCNKRKRIDPSDPNLRPRVPNSILFAIGGWSGGNPTASFEAYDVRTNIWYTFPHAQDNVPRAYHGIVSLNGLVYVLGGYDGMLYYRSVRAFNPTTMEWLNKPPMYEQRCYVSAAVLDGLIYACGGYSGGDQPRLRSVERFDHTTNQWSMVAPMIHERSDSSADALNGKLYIAGGFNGQDCLCSAEVYDPETDQWTFIAQMTHRRSGVSLTAYDGQIYVIGGFDGHERRKCGERYNPSSRQWEPVPSMNTGRSNFSCVAMEGKLYAIGGFEGTKTIDKVEYFDSQLNSWISTSDMNVNRSALGSCVVSDLPNVHFYTYYGHPEMDHWGPEGDREEERRGARGRRIVH